MLKRVSIWATALLLGGVAYLSAQTSIANLSGTSRLRGTVAALSVEIVDASGTQVTSFGGTSASDYVDDADWTDNTSTHSLGGGIFQGTPQNIADGDTGPIQVTTEGYQIVTVQGAALTALQLSDNYVFVDDADFTDGTSSLAGIGGVAEQAAPSTVTEGDIGMFAMTLNRALKVTLYNSSGTELTTTEKAEDAAHTDGDFAPIMMARRIDAAASSAGTSGDYATFNLDALGLAWTRKLDPCSGVAKTSIPIDISTATTTELTSALAGASTHYYVCAFDIVTDAANDVALVDDDTDNCASVTAGMAGGATAAEGWNFAANGGMTKGNGDSTVFKTNGTNRVICLMTSAATQLSGSIQVVAAP